MDVQPVPSQISADNLQQNGKAKNNPLKEIPFPESESSEHLWFNHKWTSKISTDVYGVDCQETKQKIEGMKPTQRTIGAG